MKHKNFQAALALIVRKLPHEYDGSMSIEEHCGEFMDLAVIKLRKAGLCEGDVLGRNSLL